METLLIGGWLLGDDRISVVDDASVAVARERVRELGRAAGVPAEVVESVVLVTSELGRNILTHARGGALDVRRVDRAGVVGLEVVAADRGAGLADPETALEGVPRSEGRGLGVGLASVCSLSDEVDFDVRRGEGMAVCARKFAGEVPRRREVGVYGRAHPGERESGDGAAWVRSDANLVVAVCDGLGHGPPAKAAADAAVRSFLASTDRPPAEILERVHTDLVKTRGAVMTVARIADDPEFVELAAVGNVAAAIFEVRRARRFGGASFVLGGAGPRTQKIRSETGPMGMRDNLVVYTDGIRSQFALEEELAMLRLRPVVLAQRIVERYARESDDALVMVVR